MVTLAKNEAGEGFINYRVRGYKGEYVEQLHALAAVVSHAKSTLSEDQKAALSDLLLEMLPKEDQIKTNDE